MLAVNSTVSIPESEISYTFSPSSKPGGQNVNKVSTRVTLHFDLEGSESIAESDKAMIREKLAGRINRQGILRVSSQKFRTREANRKTALGRFLVLLAEALERQPVRKKRPVPRSVREKRLEDKKRRSRLIRDRKTGRAEDL